MAAASSRSGLPTDALGLRTCGLDHLVGLVAGLHQPLRRLARGVRALLLALEAHLVDALGDAAQLVLLRRHLGLELPGGLLAALPQRALEVRGGLGGHRPLPLEVGLRLLAAGRRVADGVVDDRRGVLLGLDRGLLHVGLGPLADLGGVLLRRPSHPLGPRRWPRRGSPRPPRSPW
jgi:hypothetical protein